MLWHLLLIDTPAENVLAPRWILRISDWRLVSFLSASCIACIGRLASPGDPIITFVALCPMLREACQNGKNRTLKQKPMPGFII